MRYVAAVTVSDETNSPIKADALICMLYRSSLDLSIHKISNCHNIAATDPAELVRLGNDLVLRRISSPELLLQPRQHLRLLGQSLSNEELGGLEQAADFQQQRGLQQRPGAGLLGNQSARVFLERDGGTHQAYHH